MGVNFVDLLAMLGIVSGAKMKSESHESGCQKSVQQFSSGVTTISRNKGTGLWAFVEPVELLLR